MLYSVPSVSPGVTAHTFCLLSSLATPALFLTDERKGCNKREKAATKGILARETQAAQKKQGSISVICIYDVTTKQ
jgi:hypothetical protein